MADKKTTDKLPKEINSGVLPLGAGIPCSVLDNEMRVLSAPGLNGAFGANAKKMATVTSNDGEKELKIPPMLSSGRMKKYITDDLLARVAAPVRYRGMHGGHIRYGYEAGLLHEICVAFLDARRAGALKADQEHYADSAELLMRGFAKVGLIALIDEVTGYQAQRARDDLQKILAAYISKELLPWTKKFPDEFFEQVYKIHGWAYKPGSVKRPGYIGTIINKFVYAPLPDGVFAELQRLNPPVNGHRKHKHFQLLTEHTGHPHLDRQIIAVITLMRAARTKDEFEMLFRSAFHERWEQLEINFKNRARPTAEEDHIVLDPPTIDVGGMQLENVRANHTADIKRALQVKDLTARELSKIVYGDESEQTQSKVRSLLARMKKAGEVQPADGGRWRIV